MSRKKVIKTVDGICGSGKTHAALNYINSDFNNNFLYVCETIELGRQVNENAELQGIKAKLINCETTADGSKQSDEYEAGSKIVAKFYNEVSGLDFNQLLIITWATYQQIDPKILKKFKSIFLDDIRQVVDFVELNLGEANHVLLKNISIVKKISKQRKSGLPYECYEVQYNKTYKEVANELVTDFKAVHLKLALKSASHKLYIEKSKYDRLIRNHLDTSQTRKVNQKNVVTLYLSPKNDLFPNNVVLISEGLDDCNQLARILRNRDCKLESHECQSNVIDQFPPNNCKVNLVALSEKDITRHLLLEAKCEHDGYINNAEYLADISNSYLKNKDYIYIVNEHVIKYKKIESRFANGKKISTINRGLNCFARYQNVVCLTSLNFDNEKQDLMTFVDGISYDDQKRDGQMANDLQTIFRTALRYIVRKGCDDETVINAVIPDVKTMEFLKEKMQQYFDVECRLLDGYIPEKEKFDRNKYMREYRQKRII